MLRQRSTRTLGAVAMLSIAFLLGCSRAPTAPSVASAPQEFVNPSFVTIPRTTTLAASDTSAALAPIVVTQNMDGALGGVVLAGRFMVQVPAGAFDGTADITITVPDPGLMHCFLDITPSTANAFKIPVDLLADCAGAQLVSAGDLAVVRNEVTSGVWRTVTGSSSDVVTWTVQAHLEHFSEYGVVDTKAGW